LLILIFSINSTKNRPFGGIKGTKCLDNLDLQCEDDFDALNYKNNINANNDASIQTRIATVGRAASPRAPLK
jgi:hypothetical protein